MGNDIGSGVSSKSVLLESILLKVSMTLPINDIPQNKPNQPLRALVGKKQPKCGLQTSSSNKYLVYDFSLYPPSVGQFFSKWAKTPHQILVLAKALLSEQPVFIARLWQKTIWHDSFKKKEKKCTEKITFVEIQSENAQLKNYVKSSVLLQITTQFSCS